MQRTQIAHFKQRLGQIQLQEITGGIGMGEVGLKHGVMGRGGQFSCSSVQWIERWMNSSTVRRAGDIGVKDLESPT